VVLREESDLKLSVLRLEDLARAFAQLRVAVQIKFAQDYERVRRW
jgi:hypothetical protein